MIFQDPYSSLNPRMLGREILSEGPRAHGLPGGEDRLAAILGRVGLDATAADRYPHEFSGGQRQRIGIARALAVSPRFIVCDEAVSALDVSVQAQVVNLLLELRERSGLAYLFISHDLAVVRAVSHRVAVMHLGEIVETGPADDVLARPRHPYTRALLDAIPDPARAPGRRRIEVQGEPPSPVDPPPGCRFHTRCPVARPECSREPPPLRAATPEHSYSCVE
jgi:oligopeptide/dipeptide ABC transporter ATP-binding protein